VITALRKERKCKTFSVRNEKEPVEGFENLTLFCEQAN
jgi:hypothetical protein